MFIWTYIGYWDSYKEYGHGNKGILYFSVYVYKHIQILKHYINKHGEIRAYFYRENFMIYLYVNITQLSKSQNM